MGTTIEIDGGDFTAYLATPEGEVRGGLVLIHEIWGLVDHITSVADRFAAEGYLVVAPDILSHVGLSPEVGQQLLDLTNDPDLERRTAAQPMMREKMAPLQAPEYAAWAVPALTKVVDYLAEQPGVNGRIATIGFCFGGTYSFALAAADTRIRAAVPFYGAPPEATEVGNIACPVLALYGRHDERLMDSLPRVTADMEAAGVRFSSHIYEDAGHAFFNDSNPGRYDADAAADAWERTNEFLESALA
jgi:carboxymethylenebutenolidase